MAIAHIAGPTSWRPAVLRELGWRQALAASNAPVPRPVRGDWSARSGHHAAQRLLARGEDFTAVFAGNDAMAIGAISAFVQAGLRVPQDVAIVGFDDSPESAYQVIPLSSVRQDFDEIARASIQRVIAALDNPAEDREALIVPARLIVRRSSSSDPAGGGGAG